MELRLLSKTSQEVDYTVTMGTKNEETLRELVEFLYKPEVRAELDDYADDLHAKRARVAKIVGTLGDGVTHYTLELCKTKFGT